MRIFMSLWVIAAPALVSASLSDLQPFQRLDQPVDRSLLGLFRRQSCASNGYDVCGDRCMPSDAVCCNSNGVYCESGNRCVTGGCCPIGERCSGSAGTINVDLTYTTTSTRRSSRYTYTSDDYDYTSRYTPDRTAYTTPTTTYYTPPTSTYVRPTLTLATSCAADRIPCGEHCINTRFVCCPDYWYCERTESCVATYTGLRPEYNNYGCTSIPGAALATPSNVAARPTFGADQVLIAGAMLAGAAAL